jgi:biofilm PGA synthesis lipoprotein PgaB
MRVLFCLWLSVPFLAHAEAAAPGTFTVLCYHNILDDPMDDPEKYTISTAELVQQFSWLKQHGYHAISVADLIEAKSGGMTLPPKAVLLTFDDGYVSFYTRVYPLLKEFNYPAVLGLVGSWLQMKEGEKIPYEGHDYTRKHLLSLNQIREMSSSGLVEIASHTYDLHHGILANPQGNMLPAAIARSYDPQTRSYENDARYLSRIRSDLAMNSDFIQKITGKRPRVIVWPYGRYNQSTVEIARSLGMPVSLTLNDGVNSIDQPLDQVKRVLIEFNTKVADLAEALTVPQKTRPERIMHVDLDYVYDPDPKQQEENLGRLLDRVKAMDVTTVYLQAFADPDGNGAAASVYFPNRHLPMRADLFSRASWQLITRADVKVFAWMPLLAFELPAGHPLAKHLVERDDRAESGDDYRRLTPFDAQNRQVIAEVYEDLAKSSVFDGILFSDDALLDDHEDASPWALDQYSKAWGLPRSVSAIRDNPEFLRTWTGDKTRFLTEFSLELATIVRRYQPLLKTARNLYAEVALNPDAEQWYSQSLPEFLANYDYTAVMAMPFMENAKDPSSWLRTLVRDVSRQPNWKDKAVFELQSVDWRDSKPVGGHELAGQMRLLELQGARNVGYYPDDFLNDVPNFDSIRPFFSLQDFPFNRKWK